MQRSRDILHDLTVRPPEAIRDGRKEVLEEALQAVLQDRNATHGDPEDNFTTIANYWTTYLRSRGFNVTIQPVDVAWMMVLVKTSRGAKSPTVKDHYVDAAGYSACGYEVSDITLE